MLCIDVCLIHESALMPASDTAKCTCSDTVSNVYARADQRYSALWLFARRFQVMLQDRTGQDKTRQDKTRQGRARQDKTRQASSQKSKRIPSGSVVRHGAKETSLANSLCTSTSKCSSGLTYMSCLNGLLSFAASSLKPTNRAQNAWDYEQ